MGDPKIPDGFSVEVQYQIANDAETGHVTQYDTMAILYNEDATPVSIGYAYLKPGDQPVRKTGRHKAIGRAVRSYVRTDLAQQVYARDLKGNELGVVSLVLPSD